MIKIKPQIKKNNPSKSHYSIGGTFLVRCA